MKKHINTILKSNGLNFKIITHDRTIYKTIINGEKVYLLHQIDKISSLCENESTTKAIYVIIRKQLQLQNETELPLTFLAETKDL